MGSKASEAAPPFLRKVYHLVDDSSCDDIVSWTEVGTQFTIHQTNEFASDLLPKYFKHGNFSSFVRQLNSYGFRKVRNTCWSFANEYFRKGRESDLVNIKRRQGAKAKAVPSPGLEKTFETVQSVLEDRQMAFETRVHQEFQNSKLEWVQLLQRLTKVEHVQEELLRILMQPTARMDTPDSYAHAPAHAPVEYEATPEVVKSVLESLYTRMREGRAHQGQAADLVAATQAGLAAGRFGVYDPAQIEAMHGNAASRGGTGESGAGGQSAGYRGPGPDPGGRGRPPMY